MEDTKRLDHTLIIFFIYFFFNLTKYLHLITLDYYFYIFSTRTIFKKNSQKELLLNFCGVFFCRSRWTCTGRWPTAACFSQKTSTASTCSPKSRPDFQPLNPPPKKCLCYNKTLISPFNSSTLFGVVCIFLPAAVARLRPKLILAKCRARNNFLTHIVGEIHARGPSCLISSVRARLERVSERARCNLFDSDEQKLEIKLAPPSAERAS